MIIHNFSYFCKDFEMLQDFRDFPMRRLAAMD